MIINPIFDKSGVAQIAPENCKHTQFMSMLKGTRNLLNLSLGLFRTEIDGCTYAYTTLIERLLNRGKHNLVIAIRVGEKFVVINLKHKRNLVSVFARHTAKNAQRCGHGVATAFDCQFYNVFGVKIFDIWRKC